MRSLRCPRRPRTSAAADDAGLSRRYGGIHFPTGDLTGRALGRTIGALAWQKARTYVDGSAYRSDLERPAKRRGTRLVNRATA